MQGPPTQQPDDNDDFDPALIAALPEHDPAEYLDTDEAIVVFLNEFLYERDPATLVHGLNIAARARGITQLARDTGISRQALCEVLSPGSSRTLQRDTVAAMIKDICNRLQAGPGGEASDV